MNRICGLCCLVALVLLDLACASHKTVETSERRRGDEIVVCGQFIHTGAPVVLWTDPGGYDAYRVERRFVPWMDASWEATTRETTAIASPNRYGVRFAPRDPPDFGGPALTPDELHHFRGGGWDLASLQNRVDQLVFHYDACGTSRRCFEVLHDERGLSVHFMIDLDGTIYQTLDVKERAFHATTSNSRSIGIEIANIGAYPTDDAQSTLAKWYCRDADGVVRVAPEFLLSPSRDTPITGEVQHRRMEMYDLTPAQYDSLIALTAAICRTFPKINCDYPRDASGDLITQKLPDEQLKDYRGLIGHYHIQSKKFDPGPAFQWDRVVEGARSQLGASAPVPRAE